MIRLSFIGKHKIAIGVLTVSVVLGAIALRFWSFRQGMEHCESHVEATVPGPGAYDAKVVEEGCDGIVGSDTMSIVLSSRVRRKDSAVFVYSRKTGDPSRSRQDVSPTVTWLDKDTVEISIDMVASIQTQLGEVDGVKVRYRVGAVEYK
jgi:hypothetical protein